MTVLTNLTSALIRVYSYRQPDAQVPDRLSPKEPYCRRTHTTIMSLTMRTEHRPTRPNPPVRRCIPDQPDTIASTAVEEGPSASGHPAGGRRPTRKTAARRCIAVTRDGRPCRAPAQPSAPTCIFHDESRADEAAAARRLGGQHRRRVRATGPGVDFNGLGTADAIRSTLELAIADLLDLEPSIPRSRVLIAAAGVAMRLLELTDLAAEVAVLKAANRAMRPRLDPPTADFDSTITDPSEGDE
jgi:hypothetical protein